MFCRGFSGSGYGHFGGYGGGGMFSLNILNERFAKGEIDEEEYIKKKIILNQKN